MLEEEVDLARVFRGTYSSSPEKKQMSSPRASSRPRFMVDRSPPFGFRM